MGRVAEITRTTQETDIQVRLDLDGSGKHDVQTGIPFLNHMLEQFARHGFFDLSLRAAGDLEVDSHHTVEDVGICLGQALAQASGDRRGIRRFGEARVPLSEALVSVVLDLCGRPYLVVRGDLPETTIGGLRTGLVVDFFKAFTDHAGLTLHLVIDHGQNAHHLVECLFKAVGRALDAATRPDERLSGVLSTKGVL